MTELIEIIDLYKEFRDATLKSASPVLALKQIHLSIHQNDIFGIIGLSGAGKSTLMRILASLEKPTSGKVFFEGQDITEMSDTELRQFRLKVGMIFQHFNLLSSRTAFENIAYPLEIAQVPKEEINTRVEELLRLVGIEKRRDSYPSSLSGGEKQRVGIARALANHPKVLFCDEATSALDPYTTREILGLLKKIHNNLGITIVLITHEMEVVKQICNKVAVLEKGEIVEQGTLLEVFSDPKHETTKKFLQNSTHEIPSHFLKDKSPNRKLLRLGFKGKKASEPIIAKMIKDFQVEANILLGWIDSLQGMTVGTLVIELLGKHQEMENALTFLKDNAVHCEEL